jgi:hypothetical protein
MSRGLKRISSSQLDRLFQTYTNAREWNTYQATGEGLTRTALLSKTAVDFVRAAEHQFDHMLFRPKKYPVKDFPVWTLPALLFYNANDGFRIKEVHVFIKPSLRTVPVWSASSQERLCMWAVYAGLKMYLFLVKNHIYNSLAPVTPKSFDHAAEAIV